jgi:hypothetical protein
MAYFFGDGFDCYATMADPLAGYWDSGMGPGGSNTLVAGRFTGSQAVSIQSTIVSLVKASAVNDAVHHIVMAFRQTAALSGTALGMYVQLSDAATNQCCIVFRTDGTILFTSATPAGTVLATYSGAVTAQNTWFAFEFEVLISNTTGRFRARKNGNTVDDYDSLISVGNLNTRPGPNPYANKLTVGAAAVVVSQLIDDILWRSDASSVPFVGDIRCYTRMPASDASVQFARSPVSTIIPVALPNTTTAAIVAGTARYQSFTVPSTAYDGAIGSVTVLLNAGYTGNMKCSIFVYVSSAVIGAVLGSATPLVNPVTGVNTFTFSTPVAVTKGTSYWIGFDSDTSSGSFTAAAGSSGLSSTTAYAAFPVASPSVSVTGPLQSTQLLTPLSNAVLVGETIQDGTGTYVYDSTVGHADFYNIAAIAASPASTIAVITRAFVEKSDAGTRQATVQVKSGATTVQATPQILSTSFGWVYRADTVDPATGAAWTAAAVNALQIGPTVIS